ncbi:putative atpase family aaa domain-containing protein 1-a protein [Eutypa lata UCREL1]|uniref:Putative atpase family aaa domain-containing protein 1-a protein n=1 Tax=Eutypa lata (strain UCR-EL1) TaxID=1287681 RepID=M7STQ8_EUTLA|nr:putative atpase family aaa domain-containing protein 1-a protein [Eutypa lata UCREL1]
MIGLCGPDAFNTNALNEAATLIKGVDETNGQLTGHEKDSEGQPKSSISNLRRKDYDADHEEQLLSGLVNAKDIRTTFNHIHAPKETIESIRMLTTLSLIRPEAFSYGVLANERIPGCLLYGPPGTGKTLLAKAVAKESGASMIEVSAATINNMYVGESEKMVRALFRLARKREPLVIFIDEADALLGARSPQRDRASSRGVINQFLREWDGVDDDDNNSDPSSKNKKNKKAFIMVATNRPFDLDEAVLRRLPRKLLIDLPREKDRAAILKIHLRDEELGVGVDLEDLAKKTPLYSGSDLKNVCVAAAMAAVKEELVDPVTGSLVLDSPTDSRGEEEKEEGERESDGDKKEQQQEFKKRILQPRHFEAALKEIGASVSEDMQTLTAIRRFDERYGDSVTGSKRKSRRSMGFEVVPESRDSDGARVRVAAVEGGERGR